MEEVVKEMVNLFQFVSLNQTEKMLFLLLLNTSQNDLLLYGGLIVGVILLVGLVTKLMGYKENQNDMNTEYNEDDGWGLDDDFFDD